MNDHMEFIVAIVTAIIGLAIVAVIVSRRSATAQVIGAAGASFGQLLSIAVSPITAGGNYAGTGAAGSGPFTPNFSGGGVTLPNVTFPNINIPSPTIPN